MPAPAYFGCENWAYWGVAEHFGGTIYLLYRKDLQSVIARTRVPDGMTTTAAVFSNLADMCSLTVSPLSGRWYFHHEAASQFGGGSETVGFCRASWADSGSADLSVTQTDSSDPATAGTGFLYTLAVVNDGPDDATAVRVADRLPAAVDLVSAAPSQGSCSQTCDAVVCELGDLPAGAGAAITLEVIPPPLAAGIVVNTASVPALGDPDPANNQAFELTTVLPGAPVPVLLSIDAVQSQLRVLDPGSGATLASRAIVLAGERVLGGNGLATHPLTGELWALLRLSGREGRELVTLDPSTGFATPVGDTGDRFAGLTFDAGGTLYGITGLSAATPESLFVLSQTDAIPSFVLSLADGDGGEVIAFNPEDGLLYHGTGGFAFRSVDLSGPVVTPIASCGIPAFARQHQTESSAQHRPPRSHPPSLARSYLVHPQLKS